MLNFKFLLILFIAALSNGQQNSTVDDGDSSIVYAPTGSWHTVSDPMDIGGTHKVAIDPVATATFTFTGDAIYYSSGMWPYTVNTLISLDGGSPTLVDLTDHSSEVINGPETVASSVVWSQTGLDATIQHTLVISVGPGQQYAVVDSLIFTTTDHTTTTTSASTSTAATSTSSSSSAASTPTSSSDIYDTPTAKKGLSIALGLVLTTFGLLVAGAIFWFCRRKQKREAEFMWGGERVVSGDNPDWQALPMMGTTTDNGPIFLGGGGGAMIETPLSRSSSRSSGRTLPPSENLAGRGARSKSIHRPYVFGTTPSSSRLPRVSPSGGTTAAVASSAPQRQSKLKPNPRPTAGHEPTPLTSIPEASFSATRPGAVPFFYSNSPQDGARTLSPASSQGAFPAVAAASLSSNTSLPNPSSSTEPWTYPQPLSFTPVF